MGIARLIFDLETSPNLCTVWKPGYKVRIGHDDIVKERGIICGCWKWENDSKVHSITWDRKQDDTRVVKKIASLLNEADEIVAHNGNRFDIPWIRGRAIRIGVPVNPKLVVHDTLAHAKRLFNFNSNRLDYLGKYLGFGGKKDTGGKDLWHRIVFDKSRNALEDMVAYCKRDVALLEKVWQKMQPYVPSKTHITGNATECPNCGSSRLQSRGTRISAAGHKSVRLQCQDCGTWHSVPASKLSRR